MNSKYLGIIAAFCHIFVQISYDDTQLCDYDHWY